MEKPTHQFVSKLESELRMAYRAQYKSQNPEQKSPLSLLWRFLVPAFSGALVLGLVFLNMKSLLPQATDYSQSETQSIDSAGEEHFVAFNAGDEEEKIMQDMDSEDLNQIDQGVKLVAAGNY